MCGYGMSGLSRGVLTPGSTLSPKTFADTYEAIQAKAYDPSTEPERLSRFYFETRR